MVKLYNKHLKICELFIYMSLLKSKQLSLYYTIYCNKEDYTGHAVVTRQTKADGLYNYIDCNNEHK